MHSGARNAFASSAVPSFAEVAVRIREADQVSSSRKAAIGSAINTARSAFGYLSDQAHRVCRPSINLRRGHTDNPGDLAPSVQAAVEFG